MINKENIPKGFVRFVINTDVGRYEIYVDGKEVYVGYIEDEARLVFEAFNVFNKTGMMPEELANFHKGYKSHLSKHGSPQTYYVAKCSELEKQIEQLQQELNKVVDLLIATGHILTDANEYDEQSQALKMNEKISDFIKSLTTQQEEKKDEQ